MNPENIKATAETKSGSMKAIVAIIVIAAIAGGAYYFLAGKTAPKAAPVDQVPALSASDDVTSIKADLGSTTVTDADLSSFEAELNAK